MDQADDLLQRALLDAEACASVALKVADLAAVRGADRHLPRPPRPRHAADLRRPRRPRGRLGRRRLRAAARPVRPRPRRRRARATRPRSSTPRRRARCATRSSPPTPCSPSGPARSPPRPAATSTSSARSSSASGCPPTASCRSRSPRPSGACSSPPSAARARSPRAARRWASSAPSRTSRTSTRSPTTPSAASRTSSSAPPSTRGAPPSGSTTRRPPSSASSSSTATTSTDRLTSRQTGGASKRRRACIAVAVVAVLAVLSALRRALAEQRHRRARRKVVELLRAQARGDAAAMLQRSSTAPTRPASARPRERPQAARPRRAEDRALPVADRPRADVAHEADARRVVHAGPPDDRPVRARAPQGQRVRRDAPLRLLRLSAPIDRESSCPLTRRHNSRAAGGVVPRRRCAIRLLAIRDRRCSARSRCAAAPRRAQAADGITRGTLYQRRRPTTATCSAATGCFASTRRASGCDQRFQRQTSTDGWAPTTVPNAWNAGDNSVASMPAPSAGIARTSACPTRAAGMDWLVRFESVNYRSRVWLNGKPIGRNTGAYLPFELRLPRSALKRTRHEPARRPRRQPPPADGLPAVGPDRRRATRPAAGGTTAASCARSTCSASTGSTSRASSCAPTCRARRAPRPCSLRVDRAQLRRPRAARRASPAASAARRVRLGTRAACRRTASRRFTDAHPRRQAAAVVAGDAEPLHGALHASRRAGASVVGYTRRQRHPLDQGRRRAPAAQRRAA